MSDQGFGFTMLTIDQAADALSVSPRYVRRLVFEKRIPYSKFGKHVRIARADVESYIEASRVLRVLQR